LGDATQAHSLVLVCTQRTDPERAFQLLILLMIPCAQVTVSNNSRMSTSKTERTKHGTASRATPNRDYMFEAYRCLTLSANRFRKHRAQRHLIPTPPSPRRTARPNLCSRPQPRLHPDDLPIPLSPLEDQRRCTPRL